MASPYEDLPASAFWTSGVAKASPYSMESIYTRKWKIPGKARIATAGSCFAQHIARHLRQRGADVIDTEPAPPSMPQDRRSAYGFGMYSARYGNIYTAAQLLQLAREAIEGHTPDNIIWERDGRFFDALRPGVEPKGLATADDVLRHRAYHIERVREVLAAADVIVFTLGLTEAWQDRRHGTVYPTAPGTIAGEFDPDRYQFVNYGFREVTKDMQSFISLMKGFRADRGQQNTRYILTVSPVPLTATASGEHVLAATTYSKSVLRAVAGHLAAKFPAVDYFPSFEIITNQAARGAFFASNLRSVQDEGVNVVMNAFFSAHRNLAGSGGTGRGPAHRLPEATEVLTDQEVQDLQCEEALLEEFGK